MPSAWTWLRQSRVDTQGNERDTKRERKREKDRDRERERKRERERERESLEIGIWYQTR